MKKLNDRCIFFFEDKLSNGDIFKVEVDIFRVHVKIKHDNFLIMSSCYSIAYIESCLQRRLESNLLSLESKKKILDLIYENSFLNEKAIFKEEPQVNQFSLF